MLFFPDFKLKAKENELNIFETSFTANSTHLSNLYTTIPPRLRSHMIGICYLTLIIALLSDHNSNDSLF